LNNTHSDGLAEVKSPEDLARAINRLKEESQVSVRRASELAAGEGMVPLPRSTLAEILNGHRFPTQEQVCTFARVCGTTDEDTLAAWEAAWERANAEHQRFGSAASRSSTLPVSTLLETGPHKGANMLLRRSIPQAAAELSKVGPGTAAEILVRWPASTSAEILTSMSPHAGVAVLLSLLSMRSPVRAALRHKHEYVTRVIHNMPTRDAAARLELIALRDAAKIVAHPRSSIINAMPASLQEPLRRACNRLLIAEVAATLAVAYGSLVALVMLGGAGRGRAIEYLRKRVVAGDAGSGS
jgi:hypothetical protein